jgi:hypothetical protein
LCRGRRGGIDLIHLTTGDPAQDLMGTWEGTSMASLKHKRSATFIVRLWLENGGDLERDWRGQVEHVQSSGKRYVQELPEVLEFIEEQWAACHKPQRTGIH